LPVILSLPKGDGDNLRVAVAQGFHPIGEAGLEQVRVEPVDHVVEGVMGGNAPLVGQETAQERQPLLPPQLRLHEVVHAAQRCAKDQKQDLTQGIDYPPLLTRVRQGRKMIEDRWRRQRHGGLRTSEAPHESHSQPKRTAVNLKRLPRRQAAIRLQRDIEEVHHLKIDLPKLQNLGRVLWLAKTQTAHE
jgi:hypothetical protein